MLEKFKKYIAGIIAGVVALAYFLGKRKGKQDEEISQNKKVLENLGRANKARSRLNDSDTVGKLHKKYKR
ncbi:MAG: hypothetical protein ACOX7D_02240 [Alphaproteobacteria bacterium]|jgi:hypothetical protein